MKGKNGNLIINIKIGEAIDLSGPGTILIKEIRGGKVVILINADNNTIIKRGATELIDNKEIAND